MTQGPDLSTSIPRVADLVERFRVIGETSMRDLPFYNPELAVEAVGFRSFQDRWIGVLVTPWFMNLVRLPEQPEPMDMTRIGGKVEVLLPSGERQLMQGGDELIGAYESLSLHSPMFAFKAQEAARREAKQRLAELMQPSEEVGHDDNGRLNLKSGPQAMSRRAFLTARPSHT